MGDDMDTFDVSRARLMKRELFKRFRVKNEHIHRLASLLEKNKLSPIDEILVVEKNGNRLAFLVSQIAYHHVAEGELAGEPYLVSF
jgi:hypothetical protein